MVSTFGGDTSQGRTNNLHLQLDINHKGLRDINTYCLHVFPVQHQQQQQVPNSSRPLSVPLKLTSKASLAVSSPLLEQKESVHPMVKTLQDTILNSNITMKNVDLLVEVERLTVMLGGCRITFCKSGKDRTGMATTLEQSREIGERFGCGMSSARILKDANLMRLYGCRLSIAEKNIGRPVYSINKFQSQFLPAMFRPPPQVCEDLLKKDNS